MQRESLTDGPSTAYSKVETWAKEIVILSDNINPEDAKKKFYFKNLKK